MKPKHIAIVMDGNRRYAKKHALDVFEGHEKGADTLENVVQWCIELGVPILTVYALSTKNLNRPKHEVDRLMELLVKGFNKVVKDERIRKNQVRVKAFGRLHLLPKETQEVIKKAEKATEKYSKNFLNVMLCYDGRCEIVDAAKKIAEKIKPGKLKPEDIDEEVIEEHIYLSEFPPPDLIIRPGGEKRLSGFLLWGSSYAEFYFTDVLWPEFSKRDLEMAIADFERRQRRFGK